MGKSSGSAEIKYPDWQDEAAQQLITDGWAVVDSIENSSPYGAYTVTNPDDAFLGVGYAISAYPSVYDMFGKFMAGLDIEALYAQKQVSLVDSPAILNSIAAESARMDARLNAVDYPRFEAGMTDMNAAMSTGFMMGRAYIEDGKERDLANYGAQLNLHATDLAHQWAVHHLQWNGQVVSHYLSITHTYFGEHTQYISTSSQLHSIDLLWPFTVLDHQRALIGVLNGAAAATVKKDSGFQRVMSGVLGVAALLTAPITGGASLGGMLLGTGATTSAVAAGTGALMQAGAHFVDVPQIQFNPSYMGQG